MKKIGLLIFLLSCGLLLTGCHNPLKDIINPIEGKSYTDIAQICEDNDGEITTDELGNDICLFNALDRCLLEKIQDGTCEFLKQCEGENCEIQESVTQEIEPDSIVIYGGTGDHEIIGDRTIYYNDKYGITFRVWEDFSGGIIQEWDTNENYNGDYYDAHYIQIQIRNDDVPEMYKKDGKGYSPNFLIVVYENEQFEKRDLYSRFGDPEYYKIMGQNDKYIFVQTPKNVKYTDLRIFNVDNIEKNWENQCISGLHDWLKNMEPNGVFSEIVWNNDNWENAFKVDGMNMKTKSGIMYYTNDNTKRKLDFQCRAEVEAASTSTSFGNVEFVE